jgi:PAS domain S-box-containing protein
MTARFYRRIVQHFCFFIARNWRHLWSTRQVLGLGHCPSISLRLILLCFLMITVLSAAAQLKQTRRVLIINDLGIVSSPGFAEIDQGIFSSLQKSRYRIELYDESLQLTFFPDEDSQRAFHDSLIRKYSGRKPDVIIVAGPESFKLIAESHERFIQETPIIFCELLGDIPDQSNSGLHVTGVMSRLQPEQTLKAALHLLPGTKHVVVVGGTGKFDEVWEHVAKQAFQNYESKLEFTYLTNLTMPVLLERLRHLPSNTIVYHTSIAQDAAGERFIGSAQSVPLVADAANAPVFVMDDVDLRAATVGGALVDWPDAGRIAGDMAVRVLNGQRPEDIPIEISKNAYMFDWGALKRWHLKESELPPGSIVLHRQPNFWDEYKTYIIAAILALLAQAAAIVALLWQRAWRKKTQTELRKSEEKFSKAFQRSPLAFTLASLVDYRFIEVNDTFHRYTGWKRDEVVGRTPLDIGFWVDTSQRSSFLAQIRTQGNVRRMEILFYTKDRQLRTGLVSSELIELNGEPCALSLITDITEAKRAELAHRESEERFRLVANAAPVMIWMSGPDKLCNYFNQPWLEFTGRSFEQELGNGWAEGVHRDDLNHCWETYTESIEKRKCFEMQYRLRRHDGEYRWVLYLGVPRFNSDGSFAGYIGTCVDTTERKLAQEALADVGRRLIEAQEEERAWIARELHDDVNQRIALVSVELERWEQHLYDSEADGREHIRSVRDRLLDLGKDVQSLSHHLHSSKLEVLGLVAAARSFCKEFAEQHKVEIDFKHKDVPSNLPKEISLCLYRVLQEALQNALKHSGVRYFAVDLRGRPGEIQMDVSDMGVGFVQHGRNNHKGLGLISMRERLQMVKGELSIKSGPGSGTTIEAIVPFSSNNHASTAV